MKEYLKSRHGKLNMELSQAKLEKLKAPTMGLIRTAELKIVELNARIEEVNKAQIQLKNETVK